jgi:two-component system phosphate regulon sensor histidine kinase PhoR
MQSFVRYILGVLVTVLVLCAGITALWGWAWGLGLLALFMGAVAARDAWKLQALHRWLQEQKLSPGYQPGRTWEQVFGRLHSLERRIDEDQIRRQEAIDRFQQALTLLPSGIVILDQTHRILWCNPAAEAHLQIHLEQDRGQSLPYLIRQTEFQNFLDQKPAPDQRFTLHRRAQQDLSLALQLIPYSIDERMLVTQDITQWERDEKVRRDFVANVSHELRTPLTVVGGFIETLQNSGSLPSATRKRIFQTMETQTDRMRRLVEELLSLSRLESQTGVAPLTPIPLSALLTQMLQMASQLSRGQHTVDTQGDFDQRTLLGIESELASAFGNLVANAIRYTPPGGRITLSWREEGGEGIFAVQDTGIGISAEHIPRLTERFYRVDQARSRDTGGTGLGLSIVKQIALHHDLSLTIDSQPDEGSSFALRFPAHRLGLPESAAP